MGDVRQESSMEDILASIKRIIADDGASVVAPRPRRPVADAVAPPVETPAPVPPAPPTDVLELTEPAPPLISPDVAGASKQSLDVLSALMMRTVAAPAPSPAPTEITLEGMVREMLRPMLKEWLDARLPEVVETLVAREIARITGQQG
ncbi:DUF2497 domain-containing protein [Sphingomonas montana]|uniref:DUF2497 domain-containing protein n=1 Tax=Sphingomonas montana TaxID=1843236 RepID=UPI00096DEFD1|nr:DUF2497 domain-containing protein [Sphingomonas montana]